MAKETEFLGLKFKEGSLEPKVAELIRFAVNLAIGHKNGAKLRLQQARKAGASEDEIWETVACVMRPSAARVREFAKEIVG